MLVRTLIDITHSLTSTITTKANAKAVEHMHSTFTHLADTHTQSSGLVKTQEVSLVITKQLVIQTN